MTLSEQWPLKACLQVWPLLSQWLALLDFFWGGGGGRRYIVYSLKRRQDDAVMVPVPVMHVLQLALWYAWLNDITPLFGKQNIHDIAMNI